jgi:hypothetical protein
MRAYQSDPAAEGKASSGEAYVLTPNRKVIIAEPIEPVHRHASMVHRLGQLSLTQVK